MSDDDDTRSQSLPVPKFQGGTSTLKKAARAPVGKTNFTKIQREAEEKARKEELAVTRERQKQVKASGWLDKYTDAVIEQFRDAAQKSGAIQNVKTIRSERELLHQQIEQHRTQHFNTLKAIRTKTGSPTAADANAGISVFDPAKVNAMNQYTRIGDAMSRTFVIGDDGVLHQQTFAAATASSALQQHQPSSSPKASSALSAIASPIKTLNLNGTRPLTMTTNGVFVNTVGGGDDAVVDESRRAKTADATTLITSPHMYKKLPTLKVKGAFFKQAVSNSDPSQFAEEDAPTPAGLAAVRNQLKANKFKGHATSPENMLNTSVHQVLSATSSLNTSALRASTEEALQAACAQGSSSSTWAQSTVKNHGPWLEGGSLESQNHHQQKYYAQTQQPLLSTAIQARTTMAVPSSFQEHNSTKVYDPVHKHQYQTKTLPSVAAVPDLAWDQNATERFVSQQEAAYHSDQFPQLADQARIKEQRRRQGHHHRHDGDRQLIEERLVRDVVSFHEQCDRIYDSHRAQQLRYEQYCAKQQEDDWVNWDRKHRKGQGEYFRLPTHSVGVMPYQSPGFKQYIKEGLELPSAPSPPPPMRPELFQSTGTYHRHIDDPSKIGFDMKLRLAQPLPLSASPTKSLENDPSSESSTNSAHTAISNTTNLMSTIQIEAVNNLYQEAAAAGFSTPFNKKKGDTLTPTKTLTSSSGLKSPLAAAKTPTAALTPAAQARNRLFGQTDNTSSPSRFDFSSATMSSPTFKSPTAPPPEHKQAFRGHVFASMQSPSRATTFLPFPANPHVVSYNKPSQPVHSIVVPFGKDRLS